MDQRSDRFADDIEPIGIAVGVFLVLVGVVTILGSPWTTTSTGVAAIKVLGALALAALGAGLVALSRIPEE